MGTNINNSHHPPIEIGLHKPTVALDVIAPPFREHLASAASSARPSQGDQGPVRANASVESSSTEHDDREPTSDQETTSSVGYDSSTNDKEPRPEESNADVAVESSSAEEDAASKARSDEESPVNSVPDTPTTARQDASVGESDGSDHRAAPHNTSEGDPTRLKTPTPATPKSEDASQQLQAKAETQAAEAERQNQPPAT